MAINPVIREALILKHEYLENNLSSAITLIESEILKAGEAGKTKVVFSKIDNTMPSVIGKMLNGNHANFIMLLRDHFVLDEKQITHFKHPLTGVHTLKIDWSDLDVK